MCPVGGQHTSVFGGPVIRWGFCFASLHAWLCTVPITRLIRIQIAPTLAWPYLRSQDSGGRTGAHRPPTEPNARLHPWALAASPPRPWRARVQTAGGQCRHSGNSLIRFRSHSQFPPFTSLALQASSKPAVHPLLSAFRLPFPPLLSPPVLTPLMTL